MLMVLSGGAAGANLFLNLYIHRRTPKNKWNLKLIIEAV